LVPLEVADYDYIYQIMRLRRYELVIQDQDKHLPDQKRSAFNQWKASLNRELTAAGLAQGLVDDSATNVNLTAAIVLARIDNALILDLELDFEPPRVIIDRLQSRLAPIAEVLANALNREWEMIHPEPTTRWSDHRDRVVNHLQRLRNIGRPKNESDIISKLTSGWMGEWGIFSTSTLNFFQLNK
jgi:hypothetical protein